MHKGDLLKFGGSVDYDMILNVLIRFWVSNVKGQGHHWTNMGKNSVLGP